MKGGSFIFKTVAVRVHYYQLRGLRPAIKGFRTIFMSKLIIVSAISVGVLVIAIAPKLKTVSTMITIATINITIQVSII